MFVFFMLRIHYFNGEIHFFNLRTCIHSIKFFYIKFLEENIFIQSTIILKSGQNMRALEINSNDVSKKSLMTFFKINISRQPESIFYKFFLHQSKLVG